MSTCTPTYGLAYAIGSDRPCDIGTTLCAMTDTISTLLDGFTTSINRLTSIPMAKISKSVLGATYNATQTFDVVEVDTYNMADLAINNQAVTVQRQGLYWSTGSITYATSGSLSDDVRLDINGTASVIQVDATTSSMTDPPGGAISSAIIPVTSIHTSSIWAVGDQVTINLNGSAVTNVDPELTLYWFGDA